MVRLCFLSYLPLSVTLMSNVNPEGEKMVGLGNVGQQYVGQQ